MIIQRLYFIKKPHLYLLFLVITFALLAITLFFSSLSVKPIKATKPFVGLVLTEAGINDLGFNWNAYQGLQRAADEGLVETTVYTASSSSEYTATIMQCAQSGNDLCIGVGFILGSPIAYVAALSPTVDFAIVDGIYEIYPDNLQGMTFASDEVGYLAGTLAGLMTSHDQVAAVGGWNIPSVNLFINGYRNGAQCANPDVTVAVSYTNSFSDPQLGAQTAQDLISQGNDVIFGIAGATGNGAILTATQSGVWAIGLDTDQYVSLFLSGTIEGAEYLLSSAMKRVDNAVYKVIVDETNSAFTSGTKLYNLALDGVGLAPYHEAESAISDGFEAHLETVRQGIIDGLIDIYGACPLYTGLVPDEAGLGDNGWNWTAYQGLLRAEDELDVVGSIYTPTNSDEYTNAIKRCAAEVNDLCIGIGFGLGTAISNVAALSPTVNFAIIDSSYEEYLSNLRGITFASDEAGYMAGTLAGAMTSNDQVAAIGGMDIPSVNLFFDGYRNGAQCANPDVTVVVSYTNSFGDPQLGAQTAQNLIGQGNDVIFAVAGASGNGAILTATQSGVWSIGVDTDQYLSIFDSGLVDGADKLLTSAVKKQDIVVFDTISDTLAGAFSAGTMTYTLALDGVGLAPYHETDAFISSIIKSSIERIQQGIIAGRVEIHGACPSFVFLPMLLR